MIGLKEFNYIFKRDTLIDEPDIAAECEVCLSQFFDKLGRKLGIRNFWKIVLKELNSRDLDAHIELDIKNRIDAPRDSCADYSKYAKSVMDHFRINDTSIYASIHDKFISNVKYDPISHRYMAAANCTMHHALFNVTICTLFKVKEYAPNEAELFVELSIAP